MNPEQGVSTTDHASVLQEGGSGFTVKLSDTSKITEPAVDDTGYGFAGIKGGPESGTESGSYGLVKLVCTSIKTERECDNSDYGLSGMTDIKSESDLYMNYITSTGLHLDDATEDAEEHPTVPTGHQMIKTEAECDSATSSTLNDFDCHSDDDKTGLVIKTEVDSDDGDDYLTNSPETTVDYNSSMYVKNEPESDDDDDDDVINSEQSASLYFDAKQHDGADNYKNTCPICNKNFHFQSGLANHMRTHSGDKPFICEICNKPFRQQTHLRNHQRTHTGEKPFKCELCDKQFGQSGTLAKHMIQHDTHKLTYHHQCETCDKTFSRLDNLQVHMKVHSDERPFECSKCGKAYKWKNGLTSHLRSHSGEKPYACTQCDKKFSRHQRLKDHIRTHTGEQPYKCELCEKCFTRFDGLKDHRKFAHSTQRPHQCVLCEKTFKHKTNLNRHLQRHTDLKSFKCKMCSLDFTRANALKVHINTNHVHSEETDK